MDGGERTLDLSKHMELGKMTLGCISDLGMLLVTINQSVVNKSIHYNPYEDKSSNGKKHYTIYIYITNNILG